MCSRFHRDEDATTTVGTNVVLGAARFGHGKSELGWRSGRVQFWRNASIGGHGLPDRSGLSQQGAGAANGENKHANDVQNRQLGRQPDACGHSEQRNTPDVLQTDDQPEARYDGESCPDNGTPGAHREPGIDYGVATADAHDVPRSGPG